MQVEPLYDNIDGHLTEGIDFSNRVEEFVYRLLEERPERSALELSALAHQGVMGAFHRVSIERRLA